MSASILSNPADRLVAAIQALAAAQVNGMLAGIDGLNLNGKTPAEQDWGRLNGNLEIAERECRDAVSALLQTPAPGPTVMPTPEPAPLHFHDRLAQDIYAQAVGKSLGTAWARPDYRTLVNQAHAAAEAFFADSLLKVTI